MKQKIDSEGVHIGYGWKPQLPEVNIFLLLLIFLVILFLTGYFVPFILHHLSATLKHT